ADHEEAVALLRDLRERDERGDDGDDEHRRDDAADDDPTGDGEPDDDDDRDHSVQWRIDRRRQTGAVLLLGTCITFGTAHMFTGPWMRGILLAAVEVIGLRQFGDEPARHVIGGVAVAAAILTDVIGALWRVRAVPRADLPAARVHNA